MSDVTNLILSFDILENEKARIAEVNIFFNTESYSRKPLISAEFRGTDGELWYGGDKVLETPLYVGAFNHLPLYDFLNHIKGGIVEIPGQCTGIRQGGWSR